MKYAHPVPFLIGCLFMLFLTSGVAFKDKVAQNETNRLPADSNKWYLPHLPEELSFAGERMPIERWDVKEKFDKEFLNNYYTQGNVIYLVKLAQRNFPAISERLKANGVPDDFKYVCIAESNMQSWALSKAGAAGYWQIMKGTAPGLGLQVSGQVDERQHLEKSTDAACSYFKQAHTKFGNWTAAAASYNCGIGNYFNRAAFQRSTNYYDLYLPEETNKYIYRVLAFKYIIENAEQLGFIVKDSEKYPAVPFKTIIVDATIPDLAAFAIDHGTTYKILILMNPWIRGKFLPVKPGHSYTIKLPG
jgi:membrane-bound lytic murein transglycosylase D